MLALPVTVLLLVAFYPNYYQDLFNGLGGGTTGQLAPTVPTMVVMCVYVIMALGLNVVVGYAGLLDLGYVAFYAAGAYIAGWFATLQFAPHKVHFLSVGVLPVLPGLHVNVWLLLVVGAVFAAMLGIIIGLPTLRLRGDYLAIVTLGFGEIIPQAVNNGDDWFGHNVTNGPNGLTPIDSLGFGVSIHNAASFLPSSYRLEVNSADYYYWTGLVARAVHAVLLHPPSRLAPRPGLGGDPRGRDRGGGDGRAAHAHEDARLRHRRVLRRRGRAASTRSSRARPSRRTSRSTSRSRCCAW